MCSAVTGYAAPRIDEIRTIVAQKALLPQPSESLATLDIKNLDAGLQAMDPYARYVPSSLLTANSTPNLHLGLEIFAHQSWVWVRSDPGGPADKAGVPEIGKLLAINDKKVLGNDLDRISTQLDKAIQNARVNLTVARPIGGKGSPYKVKPAVFKPSSISWRRYGADLVLRISEFASHDTAPGLTARLTALVRPGDRVVLDLRGCSGGDLYEALEIAGMFVPAGRPLASTYDRSGKVQLYRSPSSGKKQRSPGLILIDRRTASAAEILAGILQYHHLTRVVGEQSYGKCVSQTLFPLSDSGGLWLTTLGVNFPNNTSCNGKGITPDLPYPDISITKSADIMHKLSKEPRSH